MAQYGWENCPDATRQQMIYFLDNLVSRLGDNLTGVYLHGSLAMGCFNPARSDIDLLVITQSVLADSAQDIVRLVLDCSGNPHPFELSFVQDSYLHPWQYPTPFNFHFSEDWREKTVHLLDTHQWFSWAGSQASTDPDLAAHITITRARGICLVGKPIAEVFPEVPRTEYLDSILGDFDFARERINDNPVYAVLNFCRMYGYVLEGRIDSKDEAGVWALDHLPEHRPLLQAALDVYRGDDSGVRFDPALLAHFAEDMDSRIKRSMA
jgi:streptomycin 3"-adenylyltransferase